MTLKEFPLGEPSVHRTGKLRVLNPTLLLLCFAFRIRQFRRVRKPKHKHTHTHTMKLNKNIESIKAAFFAAHATLATAILTFRKATVTAIEALLAEGLNAVEVRETIRVWSDEFRASIGKSADRSQTNEILAEMLGAERKRGKNKVKDVPEIAELTAVEAEAFDNVIALLSGDGGDDKPAGDAKKKPLPIVDAIVALVMRRDKSTIKAAGHLEKALAKVRALGKAEAKK